MDFKIIIGGDFCRAGAAEHVALERPDKIWGSALELIRGADRSVVNLESPLTEANCPIMKIGPNLRSHPGTVETLVEAQIDLLTLASNHIYDHGATGLRDTLDTCRRVGIETVGAGQDLTLDQKYVPGPERIVVALTGWTLPLIVRFPWL